MTQRAVLYARVSGDDRLNTTSSLEAQLTMCREHAQAQGWQVVGELAEDERGVSGARMDAPQLNRALDMAQAGGFDTLVVREMDRFARNLAKQLVIEEQFKRVGVNVVYVLEAYADTPEGTLSKHIKATIAEYEREKTKQRTLRGRRNAVKQGSVIVHGAGAPYGYILTTNEGKAALAIDEQTAPIIRLIFTWYTEEGLTVRAIAGRLSAMNIPTPSEQTGKRQTKKRGAGEWGASMVANILNRETYAGTWHYGRYNSFANQTNPDDNLIAVSVPAIIDRQTWELAVKRKEQNKEQAARNTRHDYLLRGLLKCGHCGATVGTQAIPLKDKTYLYYRCRAAKKNGSYCHTCDTKMIRADLLDAAVWGVVTELLSDPEGLRERAKLYQERQVEYYQPHYDRLAIIDQVIDKTRQKLASLLDLYLEGGIMRELLTERRRQLETQVEKLTEERGALTRELEAMPGLSDEQIDSLAAIAQDVIAGLEEVGGDFNGRRKVLELLGFTGKTLEIDGVQALDVSCYLGGGRLSFVSQTTLNLGHKQCPILLTARLAISGELLASAFFSKVGELAKI